MQMGDTVCIGKPDTEGIMMIRVNSDNFSVTLYATPKQVIRLAEEFLAAAGETRTLEIYPQEGDKS